MSASVPRTSVADLIRVAGRLDADEATMRAAAVMLGLATTPAAVAPEVPPRPPSVPLPDVSATNRHAAEPAHGDDPAPLAADDPRRPRRSRLTPAQPSAPVPPRPLRGSVTELLPPPPARRPPPEPLFSPERQRTVLSTVVSSRQPGADVDVDALVARAARREPVGRVPKRSAPTTRLGVQLLVDHSPAMSPFRRDLRLLATAVRLVVGADAVEVLAFRDDLTDVMSLSGDDGERRRYTPLPGPRPILAATELGIAGAGGSARPAHWLALAEQARVAGSPLVVLVPYPPHRWPAWAGPLTVVHWDRPTSAGQAQRAARRAAALAGVHR